VRAETPVKLLAHPSAIVLNGPQDRHRILVTVEWPDRPCTDVTAQATFTIPNTDIAVISGGGECIARGDGATQVTVAYAGRSTVLPVQVRESSRVQPPSFLNDVMPLFTRLGCNQGACHGKGMGQNGFRLSLRGYAPEWDYVSLTREFDGRRINRAVPADSLLLRKPLGKAPHEGGKWLTENSREYQVLLDWIRAGAPGPDSKDAEVRRLEILPGDRTMRVGEEQQLLVRAEYADGRCRDVTWLARFDANDAAVASVSAGGKVKILRQGATAVRAAFMGQVGVVVFTVPFDRPVRAESLALRNNFVDDHVFRKLATLRIEPSAVCGDEVFLRRAFLDTIGLLPSPAEVRTFLADRTADKRARLIDTLLSRPEFSDYWAVQLGDLLQNRKESDHDVRGTKGVRSFHEWLRRHVAGNRPWDELAREVLTAGGSTTEQPAVGYYVVTVGEQAAQDSSVVASVAQAFLGTRIGCAHCHNHPLEKYTQDDYYHFAAFFSRMRLERKDPRQGPTILRTSLGDPNQDKNPVGVSQPRTGRFLEPRPLDRSVLGVKPGEDPRVKLAAWITDPKNEYFSGAMINRLWRHFLGVGLVEPVDDLRASNPPSDPELWTALTHEFVTHKFDLKHMIRLILNSRTYQLSSATLPGNETDARFFSHYSVRRLPAEVLLDAIVQSTGVPEAFPGYPLGIRAQQLPDPSLKSYFLALFGRPERTTACACERSSEVTMPQLLHLYGGDTIVSKIRAPEGRLAALLKSKKAALEIAEELFLATLSRLPSPAEQTQVQKLAAADSDEVYRDLFWALLNSKEFAFNH
jgi:hypothetical protein